MKRLFLFLISTLIMATPVIGTAATVFADEPDEEEPVVKTWTIEEVLAKRAEYTAIRDAFCGKNWSCRSGLNSAHQALGNIYGAVAALEDRRFIITEIDPYIPATDTEPATGKVKVLYFAETFDHMSRKMVSKNVEQMYLFWLSSAWTDPRTKGSEYYYHMNNLRDRIDEEGVNILIREDLQNQSEGWLTSGIEHEYYFTPTPSIYKNNIHVTMSIDGSFIRTTNFDECVNSPEFNQDGKIGCRAVVRSEDDYYNVIFEPYDPTKVEEVLVNEPTDGPIDEPTTDGPIDEPTDGPIDNPIEAPVETAVDNPVDEPIDDPVNEPIETPVETPTIEPITEITNTADSKEVVITEPVTESTSEPTLTTDTTPATEEPSLNAISSSHDEDASLTAVSSNAIAISSVSETPKSSSVSASSEDVKNSESAAQTATSTPQNQSLPEQEIKPVVTPPATNTEGEFPFWILGIAVATVAVAVLGIIPLRRKIKK